MAGVKFRDLPIESFPAEYLEFLKAAVIKPTVVPMPSRSDAVMTRAAINLMRSKYKAAKSPLYKMIMPVIVTIDAERVPGEVCDECGGNLEVVDKKTAGTKTCPSCLGDGVKRTYALRGRKRGLSVLPSFHAAGIRPREIDTDPLEQFTPEDQVRE